VATHMGKSKIKIRESSIFIVLLQGTYKSKVSKCGSHFVDINAQFTVNLFIEFAFFVTQYSRITFVNSGESENSNDNLNAKCSNSYEFVANTSMTRPGMYCV